ncbi:MAG: ribonuclease P protein component [Gammaproteobacteria bacterium]|nr:ribonuclease P protein component [Gammaproteobacteria bacterium]
MTPGVFRYTRNLRLVSAADFRRVFDHPQKKAGDRYFTLLAQQNNTGNARLGLAVSSKTIRTAAARNRIKRIVRETFRLRRQHLDALDFVVIPRQGAVLKNKRELHAILDKAWSSFIQCNKS